MKTCSPFVRSAVIVCALTLGSMASLSLLFSAQQSVSAQGSAGAISFSQSNVSVNENVGSAAITLTRSGGSSGKVSAKVTLTDGTTSPSDYVFQPGAPDATFTPPAETQSYFFTGSQAIARQPDGKILLANAAIRLNPDGPRDTTFNAPAFNGPGTAVGVQSDGKIVIVGGFTSVGGVRRNGVARLNSDGSLDTSFDVGVGAGNCQTVAFQSDGKIVVGGLFSSFNLAPNTEYLVRLNTDGSVDSTFVKGTTVFSNYALLVQPDGKILAGGSSGLVRLNIDGSVDTSFHSPLTTHPMNIMTLALQPDGKILIGGGFNPFGGQALYGIARLNTDGSVDTSFDAGTGFGVSAIALQPDGKVIISGSFDSINGTTRPRLARLNSDGSLDLSFAGSAGIVSGTRIESLVVQDGGKIVAVGFFSFTSSPVAYRAIARFNGDLFVTWADGDTANKTINLPIVDDVIDEADETLNLTLTPVTGGATNGAITSATLTILDNEAPPAFTSGAPPQGTTKVPYSHTFTASGVPAPTFSVTSGTLPPGLFLQFSGNLSGTPTSAGTFSGITVTASNGLAPPATQTFSITILSGGTLQFNSSTYSVAENAGPVVVTVTRTGGSAGTTGISYTMFGGTATNADYTSVSGTLTFADGETSKTFSVAINNDALDEADETFNLSLNSVTGSGSLGTPISAIVTIQDDDPMPSISVGDAVELEGNSGTRAIAFPVTLSVASGRVVSFNLTTGDGSASAGTDFIATSASRQLSAGQTFTTFVVNITGDSVVEPDETFTVTLSNVQNATLARGTATGTIIGDDNAPGNPIDFQGFLVYFHYADFLGRAPDADGFNFWKGTITQCGSDAGCIEVQRIAASASFFLSIEFKETGYLVERIYKTAFGDSLGTSTFQSTHQLPVPVVRMSELRTDTTNIGQGVVVLAPGWEQALETNKQNFVNTFVLRTRFLIDYPTDMAAADYVDKLNGRAGNPLSPAERNQLVNDLSTNAKTRGQVLRAIAEHQNLLNAEFNRAFVLMQYFGYLRRNPNDSPDGDYTGYDFWLTKLNQFNGNYIQAEMVKAFLSSIEYRKRFGP
jgi:uncharacterized delta-60 repeat protein